MDNDQYWAMTNSRRAQMYPNIIATGLRISSHTSGHGMSDDHVSADDLEALLKNADTIEIDGVTYCLVAPMPVQKLRNGD